MPCDFFALDSLAAIHPETAHAAGLDAGLNDHRFLPALDDLAAIRPQPARLDAGFDDHRFGLQVFGPVDSEAACLDAGRNVHGMLLPAVGFWFRFCPIVKRRRPVGLARNFWAVPGIIGGTFRNPLCFIRLCRHKMFCGEAEGWRHVGRWTFQRWRCQVWHLWNLVPPDVTLVLTFRLLGFALAVFALAADFGFFMTGFPWAMTHVDRQRINSVAAESRTGCRSARRLWRQLSP